MSKGKYSPNLPKNMGGFIYNAKGELPPAIWDNDFAYSEELDFADYDSDGFDSYGYSAYDRDGTFVGPGQGVDRNSLTERDYLFMDDDEFNEYL